MLGLGPDCLQAQPHFFQASGVILINSVIRYPVGGNERYPHVWHDGVLPCSSWLHFSATYFPVTQTWNLTFLTSYLQKLSEFHWIFFLSVLRRPTGGLEPLQEFHNHVVFQCLFWLVLIHLPFAPTPESSFIFPTFLPNTLTYSLHSAALQMKCKPFSLTGKHLSALTHLPGSFSLTSSQTFQPGQTQSPLLIYFCL